MIIIQVTSSKGYSITDCRYDNATRCKLGAATAAGGAETRPAAREKAGPGGGAWTSSGSAVLLYVEANITAPRITPPPEFPSLNP